MDNFVNEVHIPEDAVVFSTCRQPYCMKQLTFTGLLVLVLLTTFSLHSCGESSEESREGVIVYDVTFPYVKNKVLLNVFPEEMTMTFKNDHVHSLLQSLGGIVSTEFIAHEQDRTFSQYLKAFQNRYAMNLNEKQVYQYIATLPSMRLEPTGEKDTVAGYLCDKTIAHFNIDSVPPVVLYHTKEIPIQKSNWYTQFKDIDGVLLGYEVEQYGMRMKLRAKSVDLQKVSDEVFTTVNEYTQVDPVRMEQVIDSLMVSFGASDFFGGGEN